MDKKKFLFLLFLLTLPLMAHNTITSGAVDSEKDGLVDIHACENEYSDYGPFDDSADVGDIFGGTSGSMNRGNAFFLDTEGTVDNFIQVNIELVNKEDLNESFSSLIEKFSVYQYENNHGGENKYTNENNWAKIEDIDELYLTLSSGHLEFTIDSCFLKEENPLSLVIEHGSFSTKKGIREYKAPIHYIEVN